MWDDMPLEGVLVSRGADAGPTAENLAWSFLARYRVKTTRDGYALALRQWFEWIRGRGVDPLKAERYQIEVWARELEASGLKLTTVAAKLNGLAGYYRFAQADGYMVKNPMAFVVRPQIQRESTTVGLTRPELHDLVRAAEQSTPQDHLAIMILAYNGVRAGELCGMDIEHLGRHKGAPTVSIIRKGGKRQIIPFAYPTAWALERHLAVHPVGSGALFLTREGNRLDSKSLGRIVKRMYVAAGIGKRGHPHALRHTFVTLSRDAGESDRDIIASTGHADSRMVEFYDRSRDAIERNVTHGLASFVERS